MTAPPASKARRSAVSRGAYTTSSRHWCPPGRTRAASGSAAPAGSVDTTMSAASAAPALAVSPISTWSIPTPMRAAAATTDPGPENRRATTVVRVTPRAPSAASADEAVARAPRTQALRAGPRPRAALASAMAVVMPWTSVLKPVRTPAPGTTVFTAPTAAASGSTTSISCMTACLHGIVTDRPRHWGSRPAMKAPSPPRSTSALLYSQSPASPRRSHAARWITGDNECAIGEPMTAAHGTVSTSPRARRSSPGTSSGSPSARRSCPRTGSRQCPG